MWMLWLALAGAQETPAHVEAWRSVVDWDVVGDEAVQWLSAYLATDTISPPGNEMNGVVFLSEILEREGIETTVVDHGDNRGSLIARLPGRADDGGICLLSHIDVVPSEADKWSVPPMSGLVQDGHVWGRGALDMKGMAIVQLAAMVQLARLGVPLEQDVVLVAVADEEVDGLGMKTLVADHWDTDVRCTHLLNEGGLGIRDAIFDGQTLHAISIAEKGALWLRLVAEGPAGHGSTIEEGEAPERLRAAMDALDKYRPKPRIHESFYELFHNIGTHKGGLIGALIKSRSGVRTLVKPLLMGTSTTSATLTDTLHLTGMGGASSVNVVPSEVWAQYDSRLLVGTDPTVLLAELQHLIRKVEGVHFEVLQTELGNESPWDDPLYEAIARYAVEDRPWAVAGPVVSPGFTDSIFARPLGVHAYGYVPFEITQDEALTMHGHDERVSIENIHEGTRRMFSIVLDFTAGDDMPEGLEALTAAKEIAVATHATGLSSELEARAAAIGAADGAARAYLAATAAGRVRSWVAAKGWPEDGAALQALAPLLDDGLRAEIATAYQVDAPAAPVVPEAVDGDAPTE
jgi:acetylornithine deacetylase/succinyl-diaminopimelate desuccinylase-like protein